MKIQELFEASKIERLDRSIFNDDLFNYISGEGGDDDFDPEWIDLVKKQRASGPKTLYRLILIPINNNLKIGDTLSLESKPILSVSDQVKTAVFAGCSYHNSFSTNLKDKMLVVVKIKNPTILINYDQIHRFADEELDFGWTAIAKAEREFIIDGRNVSGTVLHFTEDTGYIRRGDFNMLRKKSKHDEDNLWD